MIRLATDLTLPLEVVTQTLAVVAKRRAGKSFLARRLTEQLHREKQQVVVVDPKGDWWGLLSSADGKGPGLPFVIIGGERGHVPLEASGGEVVAKLVVEERVSVLIDLSLLRKHEVATFMAVFLETLYRLKAREQFRTPMMLVVDEADAIAPQRPQPNEARMLGAAEDIVRRGGQRGIGCTLITQRTAVLNKNVLTQAQILVALRTIGPQDLSALNEWIDVHGTPEQRKTLMASLPSLPVGDAWVWSPGWPSGDGIFQRMHTLAIETFDSGATPKPGVKRVEPKSMAEVDLEVVKAQMAATIERAKAEDPREFRKRIAALETEIRQLNAAPMATQPAVADADRKELEAVVNELRALVKRLAQVALRVGKETVQVGGYQLSRPVHVPVKQPVPKAPVAGADSKLSGGERKILTALAQYPDGLTKRRLALLAGYTIGGGGFNNYLSSLRSRGFMDGRGDSLRITDGGRVALGKFEPLPTGGELRSYWLHQVGKAERAALQVLIDAYPHSLDKTTIAERAGYEAGGGGFNNALSRLRTLELIDGRGELTAARELFE